MQASEGASRHNNFDFLRFAAASLVLFSHAYPLSGRTDEPFALATGYETGGGIAVAVFFVISGYLVCGSYLNGGGWQPYLRNRLLRLAPALAFAVLFAMFVIGPLFTTLPLRAYFAHPGTWDYLNNAVLALRYPLPGVFESNPFAGAVNGSLWTLPVEVAMYAVVLALGVCGLLRPRLVAAAWVAFLLMHYRLADALGISKWVLFDALPLFHFFKLGAFFVAGSAMYLFRDRLRFHPGIAVALLAALVATVHTPAGPLTMHLALPWLVLHFAQMRVPGLAAFGRHGDFSYGIYVLAFPVQQATIATIGPQAGLAAFVAVSFAITLALSVVSWRLVEAPALRLKAKRPA